MKFDIQLNPIAGTALAAGFVLLLGIALMAVRAGEGEEEQMNLKVVDKVDVKKYMGKWYEIASIPVWFQKDCAGGTTATYELRSDGTVKVLNQCYKENGELKNASGRAWVVDESTNAKLKVSFLPFGLKLFGGDYWVIDLGENYEYAVVGHPTREYGWILSRTPELPEDVLKGIVGRIEAMGYNFRDFKMTDQMNFENKDCGCNK